MTEKIFRFSLNVPEIEGKMRHPIIFKTFDKLSSGEYLELINNHDPRPLHYQFIYERANLFTWEYVEEGPETWRVAIGKL